MTNISNQTDDAEHLPVHVELPSQNFTVKSGLEADFKETLVSAEGLNRLAYQKARDWAEQVQTDIEAGAELKEAASKSFSQFFSARDVGKTTRPAKQFLEQYWAHDASILSAVIDEAVTEARKAGVHVTGGVKDSKCQHADLLDQYRSTYVESGPKR